MEPANLSPKCTSGSWLSSVWFIFLWNELFATQLKKSPSVADASSSQYRRNSKRKFKFTLTSSWGLYMHEKFFCPANNRQIGRNYQLSNLQLRSIFQPLSAVIYINWNFLGAGDFELIAGLSSLNRDTWLGWSAMTKTNTKTKSSCIRDTWMDRLPCTNRDTRVFCISTEIDRGFWIEMLLTNLLRNFRLSLS